MKNKLFLLIFTCVLFACNRSRTDYFVFLHPIPDRPVISDDSVKNLQEGHIKNINRLYSEGKLTAAGPFDGGGGLFFLRETDMDAAWKDLNTDPAVRAKRFNLEVHPLKFETGSICRLDSGFTMTTYHFVHFISPKNEKLTDKEKEIYKSGIELLEAKVLMEGYFTDTNSRILIVDTTGTEFFNEKLTALGASFQKFYKMERKRLYIPRGTFCEDTGKLPAK